MFRIFDTKRILALLFAGMVLAAGCGVQTPASLPKDPLAAKGVQTILLSPVTFEPRYHPPREMDIGKDLEKRLIETLEGKGYRVARTPADEGASPPADAVLEVHIDFLFISETFAETQPPPVIDIEAVGRLSDTETKETLWTGRGASRAGGVGGSQIFRPVLERMQVLSGLAENLLDSLPDVNPTR